MQENYWIQDSNQGVWFSTSQHTLNQSQWMQGIDTNVKHCFKIK